MSQEELLQESSSEGPETGYRQALLAGTAWMLAGKLSTTAACVTASEAVAQSSGWLEVSPQASAFIMLTAALATFTTIPVIRSMEHFEHAATYNRTNQP